MSLGAILAFGPTILAIIKEISSLFSKGGEAWEDRKKESEREELRDAVASGRSGLSAVNRIVRGKRKQG